MISHFKPILLLHLILALSQLSFSDGQNTHSLYNPKPYLSFDTNTYGQNLSKVQQSSNNEYYLMLFEQQKIVVTENESKNFQLLDSYDCEAKQILEKTHYIYTTTSQGLIIWSINSQKKIEIFDIWKGQYILDLIIVDDDEQNAIGVCSSQIILINMASKKFIQIQKVIGNVYTQSADYFFYEQKFIFIINVQYDCAIYNLTDRNNGFQIVLSNLDIEQPYHVLAKQQDGKLIAFYVTAYYGIFIYDLTILYTATSQTKGPINQYLIGQIGINSVVLSAAIKKDGSTLFVGLRTSGINCYDISSIQKLKNPVFLQTLASNGNSNSIFLSSDENQSKIYLADGIGFKVFTLLEQISKSKNILLNTFNQEIQCLSFTPFEDVWSWHLQISADQKYVAVSAGQDGLFLYDFSQDYLDPIKIYQVKVGINVSHDGSLFLNKRKLLIVGHSQDGFSIVDISNPQNAKYLVQFKFPFLSDCDGYDVDQSTETKLIISAGQPGIIIVDITDVYQIRILSIFHPKEKLQRSATKMVSVNREFSHGFGCIRGIGILYFSINPANYEMTLLKFFSSFGSENLWYDIFNYNYVYVADGVRGLTIIDVTDKNNPYIISSIFAGGWGEKVYQSRVYSNLVTLSHSVIGSASIIDVSNKASPVIQSQIKVNNDSSYATLLPNSLDYLMITKNQGYTICNLKSPIQVLIQSTKQQKTFIDINMLQQADAKAFNENIGKYYESVEFNPLEELVQVNQQIQFVFTLLVTNRNAYISNAFFLVQDKRQILPDWIKYQPEKSIFTAKIPSSALTLNTYGINIILVEVTSQIQVSDFLNQQLNLADNESAQIFNTLIKENYIDQNGYLQSWIGSLEYQNFYLNWYNNNQFLIENYEDLRVQKFILRKISFSRYVEPIYFRVSTNNPFNLQYFEKKTHFIDLFSQYIKIVFSLKDSSTEKLLNLVFNGQSYSQSSMVLLNDQSNVLTLFGNTDIINESFYSNKIQIAALNSFQDNTQYILNSSVFIFVLDDQEIQYSKTFQIKQLQFLQVRSFPKIKKDLQQIVDNQIYFSSSGVRSGDAITLTIFPQQIFEFDQLTQRIEIKCYFIEDSTQQNCKELNWIEIEELIGQIIINTQSFSFEDELKFKIEFFDGYYNVEDQFIIKINLLPYYFQYLLIIFLFIIICSLLLLLFLKQRIHSLFFTEQFEYFPFQILYNTQVTHFINFCSPKIYKKANLILKGLQEINKNGDLKFPLQYFSEQNVDYELLQKDLSKLKSKYKNQYILIQISSPDQPISPIQKILVSLLLKEYYKVSDQESYKIYLKIKQILQKEFPYVDWYKPIIQNVSFNQSNNNLLSNKTEQQQQEIVHDLKYEEDLSKFVVDIEKLIKVIQYNTVKRTGKVSKEFIYDDKYDFDLISECLKLDILGVDQKNTPNSKRSAFGQYLIMDQLDIQNIILERNQFYDMYFKLKKSSYKLNEKKLSIFNIFYQKIKFLISGDHFKMIGCHQVSSLVQDKRHWIQINQVSDSQVIIQIDSKIIAQEGEYRLKFINSQGYICCQQSFYYTNCIDKKQKQSNKKATEQQFQNKTIFSHLQPKTPSKAQKMKYQYDIQTEQNKPSQFKEPKQVEQTDEDEDIVSQFN